MTKFDKLFNELPDDIDCVLVTSDVNRRYFTGMKSSDGTVIAFRDKAYLIIDFRYIEKARAVVKTAEVNRKSCIIRYRNSFISIQLKILL